MKVVQLRRTGAPDVLEYVDVPMPEVGPGEVLVQARAIGVSMTDIMIRSGTYDWMPPLPAIPGTEMSGVVVDVGADVRDVRPGQHVILSARERSHRGGCYAEFATAPEKALFVLPDSADLERAAALGNYQVAYHLLFDCVRTAKGQTVLLYGAAGGVGSAVIDLARLIGLDVIAICSGSTKVRLLRDLGVHAIIDRASEDVAEAVRATTKGRGVDLILDPVGGPQFDSNFGLLAPFGMVVNYGKLAGRPQGDLVKAMREKIVSAPGLRVFSMHMFDNWPEKRRAGMSWLIEQLAKGAIEPRISRRLSLADAPLAHQLMEKGESVGKIILQP